MSVLNEMHILPKIKMEKKKEKKIARNLRRYYISKDLVREKRGLHGLISFYPIFNSLKSINAF